MSRRTACIWRPYTRQHPTEFRNTFAPTRSCSVRSSRGYCRDLHTECAGKLVAAVYPASLRAALRAQCLYGRRLDIGNPNSGNLGADFGRYGLDFWPAVVAVDASHAARRHQLAILSAWRNAIAHNDYDPAQLGGTTTLSIPQVRDWRAGCDILATTFDSVLGGYLQAVTGVSAWPP